jgi:hypothetical protein
MSYRTALSVFALYLSMIMAPSCDDGTIPTPTPGPKPTPPGSQASLVVPAAAPLG